MPESDPLLSETPVSPPGPAPWVRVIVCCLGWLPACAAAQELLEDRAAGDARFRGELAALAARCDELGLD